MDDIKLNGLKERFGEIWEFTIDDAQCIIRKPTTVEFFYFMDLQKNGDMNTYYEKIIDTLWIEGDEKIKIDDQYFITLANNIESVIYNIGRFDLLKENGKFIIDIQGMKSIWREIDRKTFFEARQMMKEDTYQACYFIKNNCMETLDDKLKNEEYEVLLLLVSLKIIEFKDITLKKK
jgi:hypothetical protein